MTKLLLIVAALADLALAALLVGVSGFLFGSGPESMHGGPIFAAAYAAAVVACLAAPVAGFILNARGKSGLGLALAFMPPAGAVAALLIPAPYWNQPGKSKAPAAAEAFISLGALPTEGQRE